MWKLLTGTPWKTTRSMREEFGPLPAEVYAEELSRYSDLELIDRGDEILTELRSRRAQMTQHAA